MTVISRKSLVMPIGIGVELATTDDLDGTVDNTQAYDVTGATRVILLQIDDSGSGDGTAGIDVLEVSHDGGHTWAADDTVLPYTANDFSGTIQAAGALNAAGVEPATVLAGLFKAGPWQGPTAIRIARLTTTTTGTTWVTSAPKVYAIVIGKGVGSPTALA